MGLVELQDLPDASQRHEDALFVQVLVSFLGGRRYQDCCRMKSLVLRQTDHFDSHWHSYLRGLEWEFINVAWVGPA